MEKYIQPFIEVCQHCFKEFVGAELRVGRPYIAGKDSINEWDISAVIGLTGEARGAVVISMKKDLVITLTDMLTNTVHKDIDEEVVDAIGEIVNIIAGNAKKGLEEAFRLVISLPTIVQGKGHAIKWPNTQARIICIPFDVLEHAMFILSVAIEPVKGS
ncbi:MAG: chemotaxis protein CheX [Treponema sp.]|jgi:chemotaxis protein CheX|nr:chemotaxis protein CheX [Treponema sp.]